MKCGVLLLKSVEVKLVESTRICGKFQTPFTDLSPAFQQRQSVVSVHMNDPSKLCKSLENYEDFSVSCTLWL